MRWTMHFKLNPDLSMLLYLALSIKLLKDCESRSSLLVSSPGEAKRSKAKQSEARAFFTEKETRHSRHQCICAVSHSPARFHCMKLTSTQCPR